MHLFDRIRNNRDKSMLEQELQKKDAEMKDVAKASFLSGQEAGAVKALREVSRRMPAYSPEPTGSLGMSGHASASMGDEVLSKKALQYLSLFDDLEEQGADPRDIANQFKKLPPQVQVEVARAKKAKEEARDAASVIMEQSMKNAQKQQLLDQQQQVKPVDSVQKRQSPITMAAQDILNQTVSGQQQ
jgi:hypothetical protein